MFFCKYCNREFKANNNLVNHEKHCSDNPERHLNILPANKAGIFYCRFCNRFSHSENSLINHEIRCKHNPCRRLPPRSPKSGWPKGKTGWSKGLTKDSDTRISNISVALKKGHAEGTIKIHQTNKPRTQDEKDRISKTAKLNKKSGGLRKGSGRGKKGWYKGYFCDSTYELIYVIYNIDHSIAFERCQRTYIYTNSKGETHKYYPDFELNTGELIEIKGYHTNDVDLKIASVTDRPIKVLYKVDLEYAFKWVSQNYTYKQLSDLYE